MRSSVALFLCLFALAATAGEFDVRPAPAWVEWISPETAINPPRENVRWGIYDVLSDHQIRAGSGSESHYFRTVRKVLSPSGVQNASELSLDFDPSFERLTIHRIEIVRGAQRIDALEPAAIRVIQKEDDAENRIYDGERTALIFLDDVRPGDAIDYSYSLDGQNSLLNGRYTDEYQLSSSVPARRIRHRLLWPAERPLHWRGMQPAKQLTGSTQSYVWERVDVAALALEDSIPSWYQPWESVQVTEFASWSEVTAWAALMFRIDERSRNEVRALAERLSAEHPERSARITAAIRFVQDDIRYLGIEMGRNSHEPHQPWETLEQRWGDCKDKTLLLVTLLRELGLEAYPALVNTTLQHRLADTLPSPFLFDHVIAQVVDKGKVYWIDGTIADQGGTLETIETPGDGLALVVRPETSGLTKVVTNTNGSTLVEQTYATPDFSKPTSLEVKTTLTGADADTMRAQLATFSLVDFAHDRINELATDQPKIQAVGAPQIADDRLRNVIVITEKYSVPELWEGGSWTWYPRVLESNLTRPDTMIRTMPLSFVHPLDITQMVRFDFGEKVDVDESTSVTETPTFRYEYSVDRNGQTVWIKQKLRSRRDHVDVAGVPDHLTKLNAIWSEIGYRLSPDGAQPVPPSKKRTSSPAGWIIAMVSVAGFVVLCVVLARRNRREPAPRAWFAPGEAPASALTVARAGEIDAHLARLPCSCGESRYSDHDVQHARYAERDLTIVVRRCGACGREQSVYFTAA